MTSKAYSASHMLGHGLALASSGSPRTPHCLSCGLFRASSTISPMFNLFAPGSEYSNQFNDASVERTFSELGRFEQV